MRKFIINVNGNSYEVEVEEVKVDSKQQMPAATVARPTASSTVSTPVSAPITKKKEESISGNQEIVEAPMPGSISKIFVTEGQEIKSGDILLILEAMKMENEILAPRDGKVLSISTTTGASVNTGDRLVVLD